MLLTSEPVSGAQGASLQATAPGTPPLIVHLIHQLGVGGLENGLVNLINNMPPTHYRHAIVCLKDYTDFHQRITTPGVQIISLNKLEGKDWRHYLRLYRTLRDLRPALIHTRNLGCIEGLLLAALAGIKLRVHGEHGRDMHDLHGTNWKYNLLRKMMRPLVGHFIAVSQDLQSWLVERIGAHPARVTHIGNGVNSLQFHPRLGPAAAVGPPGFLCNNAFVIGSVGRMVDVKDFKSLVQAFLLLLAQEPGPGSRLRLIIAGDGPCREACLAQLRQAGVASLAWLPGARDDVPQLMRAMDLFVLPSLTEGSSNTILEAMSSGLPVVATTVGGNVDLVQPGWTGTLVPPQAPDLLADAIADYYSMPELGPRHGMRGRRQVLAEHSLLAMSDAYLAVYDAMFQSLHQQS
ncbi:TIGR03088 family PEP-CTERM/XrtA system glycosyltransferase [Janthinobacterium agaricidamnosum]|uniref:Glycosyl transferases group 1 family protein n=1 Tax=Janthinobacterium agaricidamnosum NBRC 102515 = DSM 9628 TaxID=1349767 RepID=W0V7E3_9BURK|nr:TIGR03088 family PEP-CTERM/XrtA system glycosyltransferase [Janthinobacterium agaricidamnosum]CDG83273.1 glycosyl transferases group 1 family protein [Janthinobacterium agaricidamnosum NBRC 102515 = DSM 9628]